MNSTNNTYEMRTVRPDTDWDGIRTLFKLVFGFRGNWEHWAWKYRPPWAHGTFDWVVIDGDKIIAHIGAMQLRGWLRGRPVRFFQMADVMKHPDYRTQHDFMTRAIVAYIDKIHRENPDSVIYGFSAHPGFLWYERMGLVHLLEKAVHLTVLSDADPPGEPVSEDDLAIREWAWDNAEVDRLWEQMRDGIEVGLIRDGSYLRWRYGEHPRNPYRLLGIYRRGETVGWLVVIGVTKEKQARRTADVVDLLLPESIRLAALRAVAQTLDLDGVKLGLPSRMSTGYDEVSVSRVNVLHLGEEPPVPSDYLREHLYYTYGDIDWN
jgi:hypothetical protein